MADNATHDYQAVSVIAGGHRFTGFARGDSFSLTYDEDLFEKVVGNLGLGAWRKNYGGLAAVGTLEFWATSNDNDIMTGFMKADFNTPAGFMFPMEVIVSNGTTLITIPAARVMKVPDIAYGDTINTRSWAIGTTKAVPFIGGVLPTIVGSAEEAAAIVAAAPPLPIAI